jgi:hypothetical protein
MYDHDGRGEPLERSQGMRPSLLTRMSDRQTRLDQPNPPVANVGQDIALYRSPCIDDHFTAWAFAHVLK